MLKKIISIMLCALLALSALAGCGKKADTSKQVTLKWAIPQDKQKDADEVQKLVNEKLKDLLPNTKIEFVWEPALASKWSMWMAAKTDLDLAWTGYQFDMYGEYLNGSYTELTDLVKDYGPNLTKEMEDLKTAYDSSKIDGRLYAIPNEQPILHQSNWLGIKKEWWSYFPVDEFLEECHKNPVTTEKVYQLYEQYLVALTNAGLIKPGDCSIDVVNFFLPVATRGYDWVGAYQSGDWLCYKAFDDNAKIECFMQTDAYKLFIKYAARWFDMGYISSDYLATGQPSGTRIGGGNQTEMWYGLDEERGVRYMKDADGNITSYYILLDSINEMFNGSTIFGSEKTYTVVPYTSKNPERAVMLLDLLHSEKGEDLLNLIVYGEEGKHYTKEKSADGDYVAYGNGYTIQPSASNDYGIPHWMVCNVFDCYRTPNIMDGQKEWAMDFIKNSEKDLHNTKYKGFMPDLSSLSYKMAQVKSAITEYHNTMICGAMSTSYQSEYDSFMKKIEAAGLNDVLTEIQKQADEFIKK